MRLEWASSGPSPEKSHEDNGVRDHVSQAHSTTREVNMSRGKKSSLRVWLLSPKRTCHAVGSHMEYTFRLMQSGKKREDLEKINIFRGNNRKKKKIAVVL